MGIPLEAIVTDEVHTQRLFGVEGMIKKRIGRVFDGSSTRLREKFLCRIGFLYGESNLFLLCERRFWLGVAVRTEGEVGTETIDACLCRAIIVTMVEDVIDADVRHRVLAELLLEHEIPDAEGLALVAPGSRGCILVLEDVASPHIAVHLHVVRTARNRVAVEHVDIIVPPKGRTKAAGRILIIDADINLMLGLIKKLTRHIRIALVNCMEVSVAEFSRPMLVELLLHFQFQTCDLRLADIFEAVEHIGGVTEFFRGFKIRMEVDIIARVVSGHVVTNRVVEEVRPHRGLLCLSFDTDVEVNGLLGLQVRIASPIPTKACTILVDGAASVHLPVVVQLAHARLGVARTDVGLEAKVGVAIDVVRNAEVCRHMRAEKAAVVETYDGREDGVVIHHPCITDGDVIFIDGCLADNDLIL